ncbi:MAG: rhamnan synthesis F family protein [Rhodoglobus sp.]
MTDSVPVRFRPGGRRVIFYLYFEPRGIVGDYVPYKLERLRPFAETIVVISNGPLTDEGRHTLESVADHVWTRENIGFDVWGYKEALEKFGEERLAEYDELILMNYTWYGPVRPFEPVFKKMEQLELDFWGITEHGGASFNPFDSKLPPLAPHIQSHWIAVRPRLFLSGEWRDYWRDMPMITSYVGSVLNHESRFTSHFASRGYRHQLAFAPENYPTVHPAFDSALQLIEDGCPVLKRRPFFHDPLYLDSNTVVGRWLMDSAAKGGYPVDMILSDVVRSAEPRVLNTNASLLEIMPDTDISYDKSAPLSLAAVVHIYYEEMTDELLKAVSYLPEPFDLYITTTSQEKAHHIESVLTARADPQIKKYEIRVLPSNRGRDLSAFFVACRDVITTGGYDLIFKVHSKKTVQRDAHIGDFFKRQQLENILHSPGYVANLIALFQQHPGLGLVFPPTIHMGFPTLGGAWYANKEPTAELNKRLGIHVPLDDVSPLAPMGAMWVVRPEAIRLLTDVEWDYTDYFAETEHRDGGLAHVQERILAYAAAELGYHPRTVANSEYAAISHTFLEYKLDQIASAAPGTAQWQVPYFRDGGLVIRDGVFGFARIYINLRHPKVARTFRPLYLALRAATRGLRGAVGRGPKVHEEPLSLGPVPEGTLVDAEQHVAEVQEAKDHRRVRTKEVL